MSINLKMVIIYCIILSLAVSCATKPSHISPKRVSYIAFSNLSCDQIRIELLQRDEQVDELHLIMKEKSDSDTFWWVSLWWALGAPYIWTNRTNPEENLYYANLKGEQKALERAFTVKGCIKKEQSNRGTIIYNNPFRENGPQEKKTTGAY